eukprot:6813751-Pyramimonas_sp.AAC.1
MIDKSWVRVGFRLAASARCACCPVSGVVMAPVVPSHVHSHSLLRGGGPFANVADVLRGRCVCN